MTSFFIKGTSEFEQAPDELCFWKKMLRWTKLKIRKIFNYALRQQKSRGANAASPEFESDEILFFSCKILFYRTFNGHILLSKIRIFSFILQLAELGAQKIDPKKFLGRPCLFWF